MCKISYTVFCESPSCAPVLLMLDCGLAEITLRILPSHQYINMFYSCPQSFDSTLHGHFSPDHVLMAEKTFKSDQPRGLVVRAPDY